MTTTRNFVAFLLVLPVAILFATGLTAQGRPSRGAASGYGGHPERDRTWVSVSDAASVRIVWDSGAGLQDRSFAAGVAAVGGFELIGASVATDVLIAGRSGTMGCVVHWQLDPGTQTWGNLGSFILPNADFAGIAHLDGTLFLLDAVSKTILRATWDPATQAIGGLQLSVFVTSVDLPVLNDANYRYLLAVEAGSWPGLSASGVYVPEVGVSLIGSKGPLVREVLGVPAIESFRYDPCPQPAFAVADEALAVAGSSTLVVHAPAGLAYEILGPSAVVIGAESGAIDDSPKTVSLTAPLVAGETYVVRVVGSGVATTFKCMRRHGFPEAMVDGAQMGRIRMAPEDYVVGNSGFRIACPVTRTGGGARSAYLGLMIMGFDDAPVVPVQNGQGTNQILVSEYWVGAGGFVAEHAWAGSVDMSFPIPNTPALEGLVLLAQFVVADAAGLRLSEVIGFAVGPTPGN